MNGVLHDFHESLAGSHRAEDYPFWEEVYRKAFPTMVGMFNHRRDGEHQRHGIDRSVILENGKQLWIDEKVRWEAYDDIALEYWGNKEERKPGWVCKPLMCDYIAYAVAPTGKCYLLPVLQMQEAWRRHGEYWIQTYQPPIPAKNGKNGVFLYTTVSCGVPIPVLFKAIGDCLRINFTPFRKDQKIEDKPQANPEQYSLFESPDHPQP